MVGKNLEGGMLLWKRIDWPRVRLIARFSNIQVLDFSYTFLIFFGLKFANDIE